MQIDTPRLRLVPMSRQHAEAMLEGQTPPGADWADGYPADATLIAAAMVVTAAREGRDLGPWQIYQVVREGQVIAGMGFIEGADDGGEALIGFSETEVARDGRYTEEALAALIDHGRRHGARRIRAEADHPRVAEVLASAGMSPTGSDDGLTRFVA